MNKRIKHNKYLHTSDLGMTRRQFGKMLAAMGALGYIDNIQVAWALETDKRRLGWRAHRTAGAEGSWDLTEIEGEVPGELNGSLFRVAPGLSESYGVTFKHLFDGDPIVSKYTFNEGKVQLRTRYVETPQRLREQKEGRLLYGEFGTGAPPREDLLPYRRFGGKNQPSVNIVPWGGQLLGLSEGGHPSAIDADDLSFKGYWDFHGTLPKYMSFTAHPRFDPETGEGFAFGTARNALLSLNVYRMELDGTLTQIHSMPQKVLPLIHDVMLSKNYLIFALPPLQFDFMQLAIGKLTPAEALKYFEREPLRFVIMTRDGSGKPITIEQPSNMVYHHGNAFEKDGKIVIDTLLSEDDSMNRILEAWDRDDVGPCATAKLTRLVLDPKSGSVVSRDVLANDQEFPRFDPRASYKDSKYLFAAENGTIEDQLAMTKLVRTNLHTGSVDRVEVEKGRTLGEPVYVPRPGTEDEDSGWILQLGYDGNRDKTYLDIRDAATMDLEARVWTPTHLPLGFHGNFHPA